MINPKLQLQYHLQPSTYLIWVLISIYFMPLMVLWICVFTQTIVWTYASVISAGVLFDFCYQCRRHAKLSHAKSLQKLAFVSEKNVWQLHFSGECELHGQIARVQSLLPGLIKIDYINHTTQKPLSAFIAKDMLKHDGFYHLKLSAKAYGQMANNKQTV